MRISSNHLLRLKLRILLCDRARASPQVVPRWARKAKGSRSFRELEARRDDLLVELTTLVLKCRQEAECRPNRLKSFSRENAMRHGSTLPVLETTVVGEWVDYNGHMNDAAYAIVFSRSVDALMDRVGLDAAARKQSGQTLFTLQMMLHYFKEAKEGDALTVSFQLLEHDDKRMRVWLDMTAPGGERLAASEQLLISVAQGEGSARAVAWSFETKAALEALAKAQSGLPHPPAAGSGVALKRS
jgi:acyl-CoA thioester hydrolase